MKERKIRDESRLVPINMHLINRLAHGALDEGISNL